MSRESGRSSTFYWTAWWLMRRIGDFYFRWQVHHPERVPGSGAVLLAANHASFGDPPLIGAAMNREVSFLARDSLFDTPVLGGAIRKLKAIPVDRDGGGASGLKALLGCLENGGAALLFPEGTRTRTGELQPVRAGLGLAVVKSSVPVVPVRIWGSYEAWGRRHVFPRPRQIVIKFGQPMRLAALRSEAKSCGKSRLKEIYQECADDVMDEIRRMQPCRDVDRFP